ncbi:hypothetical protein QBC43DRAFT_353598 [Cladorrhinum sp. PSN259]|nr:hypothetical protein QBC43DRAFT_353598 [Cladorrhinum sp. PSN259]
MSVSPTTGMSRLSLDAITAKVYDQNLSQLLPHPSPVMADHDSYPEESEWDQDEDEETNDNNKHIVSSPTGLHYNISQLPHKTQQVVRGLFNQTIDQGPPPISLELCGIKEDDDGSGIFYAFQMHEVVPCSVRIGNRKSNRFSTPKCECPDARYRNLRPCKHLIWLFDRISKQTLFDHDPDFELTLTEAGYPEEIRDIYEQISQTRLDVLADGLHCDISEADSDSAPPSPARINEVREMVASLAGVKPWELDGYRPDLNSAYNQNTIVHRGDLEATLFSLLLSSHSLAEWVRSELEPTDPAVDPFRKIHQQVSRIVSELETYSSSLLRDESASTIPQQQKRKAAEGPRDVAWAATQIQQCVRKIEKLVSRGSSPLSVPARASAARALVGILKLVVSRNINLHPGETADDRNLYMRLVGNHDTGFVYSGLDLLVDQSQFIEELEGIMDQLGRYGAPTTYVANMRDLIARMRHHKAEDVISVSSASRRVSRADTPPLPASEAPTIREPELEPPARHPETPISSGSPQFLTPDLPASSTPRGGRGARGRVRGRGSTGASGSAAGSKRSVSLGSAQDSPRGSKKRARGV